MEELKNELNNSKVSAIGNGDNAETEPMTGKDEQEESLFDTLMVEIGNAGKFQKRFNFLYNFVMVIVFTMPYLNIILVMTIPEHWCYVPGRESTNYSLDEWKEKWLPKNQKEEKSFSSCQMFAENDTRQTVMDCQYGWDFDRQWYSETVVSEESWVCDKEIYVSNTFAAGRVGEIIGTFVFGQLGDRFGRKPVFYMSVFILIVGRIMSVFTSNYYHIFLFSIALGSTASTSVFQSPLVISMEVSDEKKRSQIAFLQCTGWVVGLCLLAFLSWGLKDWKLIMLVSTLPSAIGFVFYKMLPESPRWLASRGKIEESVEVLKYISRVNKTKIPRNTYSVLEKIRNKKEKFYGLATLFANWRLAKNTIIIITCWSVSAICYYVITLNVTNMSGNPFMNFFWQSLVELPGYILGKILSEKMGRRWTQTGAYFTGSLFCMLILLVQTCFFHHTSFSGNWSSSLAMSISGVMDETSQVSVNVTRCYNPVHASEVEIFVVAMIKLALTTSFYMVWLQAIEIYPTCVRQTGTSIGGMMSNVVGILGPYVVYLGTSIDERIPYVILLVMILLGAVCSSFLPETLNKKLPETLDDAKVFGKNQKYWSFSLNKG